MPRVWVALGTGAAGAQASLVQLLSTSWADVSELWVGFMENVTSASCTPGPLHKTGTFQPTLLECNRRPAQNPEIRDRLTWNPKIRRRPAQDPEIRVGPLWSLALTFPASYISHHWLRCPDESAAPKGQLARPQAPINCPLAPGTCCLPLSGEAERNLMSLGLPSSLAP